MNHLGRPQIEGGDPSVDLKAFRRALGNFPTGVTIITAPGREAPVGVTANSFSSVSLAPPLVLWSISNTSRSYKTFRESEHFAINVLADDQVHVSQNFASSRDDKFDSMAWRKGKTGSPLIDEVLAYFDCICEARHDCGDHTIIIGRVVDFARFEGAPLLFTQGRYGMAVDHIEVASRLSAPNSRRASLKELPLLSLIAQAHYKVDVEVEEKRIAAGISQVGSKVLAGLYQSPPLTAEDLSRRMYLDLREVDDALKDFLAQKEVEQHTGDRFALTEAGRARHRAMMEYLAKYQAEQLSDLPPSDIAVARRVLESLLLNGAVTSP